MLPSIRCTSHCPHIEYHVSACCSSHVLHGIVHMFHMRSPHHSKHLYLCFSPYGLYATLQMVQIMSPYAFFHTLDITLSTYFISCLHMLLSTWFAWILHMVYIRFPHHWKHLYLCFSPYGYDATLHVFKIMSPYVFFHTLDIALSTYFISCLHMLFSTWFACNFPHA